MRHGNLGNITKVFWVVCAACVLLGGCAEAEPSENEMVEENVKMTEAEENIYYTVSGKIIGLKEGCSVADITFKCMDKEEQYKGTLTRDGYSAQLPDGSYEVSAYVSGYLMMCHVVVNGAEVRKDLLYTPLYPGKAEEFVSDIYVGCEEEEHNYESMRAAVKAIEAMRNLNEEDRITVHIAPGLYREQVVLNSPNVSFVNTNPEEEVKLTWYYGVGYQYYSAGANKYYNENYAHDKYLKNTVDRWGAATYIKSGATGFYAENITFENSFTKYICEEELEDGVEPTGETNLYDRAAQGADATLRAANERSAALAVEGDRSEFYHCRILGGQDTMYTGSARVYFKDCFLEGNTDYIFGKGDIVFENCELQFYGYSDVTSGAVLTAAADGQTYGYIFRNCFISANPDWKVAPAKLGRPWRATAMVSFVNCKLAHAAIIDPVGWGDMSNNKAVEANFKEYHTTAATGEEVYTKKRITGLVTENPYPDGEDIINTVFDGWHPAHYVLDTEVVSLKGPLTISGEPQNGAVLTADFALNGTNEDVNASVIQWYRVTADGEKLVKASVAYVDRTYTVMAEDVGAQLKVVVLPETVSGYVTETVSALSATVTK